MSNDDLRPGEPAVKSGPCSLCGRVFPWEDIAAGMDMPFPTGPIYKCRECQEMLDALANPQDHWKVEGLDG